MLYRESLANLVLQLTTIRPLSRTGTSPEEVSRRTYYASSSQTTPHSSTSLSGRFYSSLRPRKQI